VTSTPNADLDEALGGIRQRGGSVRAWVVGEAEVDLDVPVQRAGLTWPI